MKKNKWLKWLLLAQLILVYFQLGLRQFLDSSLFRDFFLIIITITFFFSTRQRYKSDRLSRVVALILVYGVIVMLVHSFTSDSVLASVTQFRNFFFPLLIVPIFKGVFLNERYRLQLVNLFYYLFIILLIDIYVEYLLYLFDVSRDFLPWYPYQYAHLYRFTTAPDPIPTAVSPDNSPILGLFGWPLNSSAVLLGLFSFIFPWLLSNDVDTKIFAFQRQKSSIKYFLVLLVIGALFILQVKTTIFALFVILLLYFNSFKKLAIKVLPILVVAFVIIAASTKDLWIETITDFQKELDEGEMALIFDPILIGNLINSFLSGSFVDFLFGADFSHISLLEDLEIRLIYFTFELGFLWVVLFCVISWSVISVCKRLRRNVLITKTDSIMLHGIFLSYIAYLVDMLHYANMMYLFNIFFVAVMLALLSSLTIQYRSINNSIISK